MGPPTTWAPGSWSMVSNWSGWISVMMSYSPVMIQAMRHAISGTTWKVTLAAGVGSHQ